METVTYIGVTIISENDKHKRDTKFVQTTTLLGATRVMNTFKPKRGYKVIKFIVEECQVLV